MPAKKRAAAPLTPDAGVDTPPVVSAAPLDPSTSPLTSPLHPTPVDPAATVDPVEPPAADVTPRPTRPAPPPPPRTPVDRAEDRIIRGRVDHRVVPDEAVTLQRQLEAALAERDTAIRERDEARLALVDLAREHAGAQPDPAVEARVVTPTNPNVSESQVLDAPVQVLGQPRNRGWNDPM